MYHDNIHISNMISIIILTILYVTIAIIMSSIISKSISAITKKIMPYKLDMESETTIRLLGEIYFNLIVITLASYIMAHILNLFPHTINVDVSFGIIFGFILFYYPNNLREKINYVIYTRI